VRIVRKVLKKSIMNKVRIWDLPTRLFHWALVICFIGLFITGKTGGNAMDWHFRLGFTMASLLLFRIFWGWFGGHWSRFSTFIYSPRSIRNYLTGRGSNETGAGHNPLGACSVFAMLFFLLVQVGTGLFSEDQEQAFGPLSRFVSNATVRWFSAYHKNIGQTVLLVLIVLHLAAIIFYQVHKKNDLIGPMINGDKVQTDDVAPSRDDVVSRLGGAMVFVTCAVTVAWLVHLLGD
jgi:cytochrome b